jgi:2-hydroxychromene-2-carboxylate isomerase
MPDSPAVEFWYDHASTYSYLSAMRIDALAAAQGVRVVWRPFLLGPIFQAQGWTTSPFNLYPAKGRYMRRDLERLAISRGLPFKMPAVFPANSLLAARIALAGEPEGWTPTFSRGVFEAAFARGEDIGEPVVLAHILTKQEIDSKTKIDNAATPDIKLALRARTDAAISHGIFGAPSFRCADGELFWGDDRLEAALAWAVSPRNLTGNTSRQTP